MHLSMNIRLASNQTDPTVGGRYCGSSRSGPPVLKPPERDCSPDPLSHLSRIAQPSSLLTLARTSCAPHSFARSISPAKRPICVIQDEAFGVLHQVIAGLSVDSIAASLQAAFSMNASTSVLS
jgi:hypothetical protein